MKNVDYNECLAYLYDKKYGYTDELKNKLGEEVVRQLEAMGYIENAFDSKADTWRISERAKKDTNVSLGNRRWVNASVTGIINIYSK